VTLTAAERVCATQPGQEAGPLPVSAVLPTLAGLVGKSLLTLVDDQDDNEPRYRMLDTVRACGLDRLAEAGEDTATRDAATRDAAARYRQHVRIGSYPGPRRARRGLVTLPQPASFWPGHSRPESFWPRATRPAHSGLVALKARTFWPRATL
jgi:predicted ATPase